MPSCAFISFRLGGVDGVSKVTAIWQKIFSNLGYEVFTIAGEGEADFILPELGIGATHPPKKSALENLLATADLVVVENLCTIPLNVDASLVVADVLRNRPAIMHHHDLPWQRKEFAHITDIPVSDPNWLNITINKASQKEMEERGFSAHCVYNPFKVEELDTTQNAQEIRARLGVDTTELLVAHPSRAIPRKNIKGAIQIVEQLGGTYWLTGFSEPFEDYQDQVEELLNKARCRYIQQPADSIEDIYRASDLIVFPSHWESFGLPPVEAAIYKRHVVVGDYPVAKELMSLGFKWFLKSELREVKDLLGLKAKSAESAAILENNFSVAAQHFSTEKIQAQIQQLLESIDYRFKF